MNREYKFRGKRVDNGQWVYGYLVKAWDDTCYIITEFGPFVTCCDECGANNITVYEVIPETVGQYTGLNDKDDKEIYKGDIVKCTDLNSGIEFIAVVEFGNPNCEYSWGYQLRRISGDNPNLDILLWVEMEDVRVYCEVVGNLHDNPELLKEAANE